MRRQSGLEQTTVGVRGLLVALIVLVAIPLLGCAHTEMAEQANDDEQLTARLDTLATLYETRNVAEIRTFYAPEVYSMSTNNPVEFATGLNQLEPLLTNVLQKVTDFHVSWLGPMRAWKDKDRTWTNRDFKVTGTTASGEEFVYAGRHSAIWEKRNDQWLIWFEHFRGAPELLAKAAPPPPVETPAPAPPPAPVVVTPPDLDDVFFDFDLWAIRPDQVATLEANLKLIQEHPNLRLRIEGYCDMRGTDSYNLVLGQRRAESAMQWLVDHGVDPARIEIVSRGRVEKWAPGSGETNWWHNRRAHFVLVPTD